MAEQLDIAMWDHFINTVEITYQTWAPPVPTSFGVTPRYGILTLTVEVTGWGPIDGQPDIDIANAFLENFETFYDVWYADFGLKKVLVANGVESASPSTSGPTATVTNRPTIAPTVEPTVATPAPSLIMRWFETMVMLDIKSDYNEVLFRRKNLEKDIRAELRRALEPRYEIDDVEIENQVWTTNSWEGGATLSLTLYVQGDGPESETPDEAIVRAFQDYSGTFEASWFGYGLTDFDQAYVVASQVPSSSPSISPSDVPSVEPSSFPSLLPSVAPSSAPSSIPSSVPSAVPSELVPSGIPSMTDEATLPPDQSAGNAAVFRGEFETPLHLRLYGIPVYIPDEIVGKVEDVVRSFIHDFAVPTPNVALTVTSAKLTHQWINYGPRRLLEEEEEEDVLGLDMTVKGRAISTDEDALNSVNFNKIVQDTFVKEYEECLDRFKAVNGMFSFMDTPVQVGGLVIGPDNEAEDSESVLSMIQPWLLAALAILFLVLVSLLTYMYFANKRRRTSPQSGHMSKGDEVTVIPISEIDVFVSALGTSPPGSPKANHAKSHTPATPPLTPSVAASTPSPVDASTPSPIEMSTPSPVDAAAASSRGASCRTTGAAVEQRFNQIFDPAPRPQETFALSPRSQSAFTPSKHDVFAPAPQAVYRRPPSLQDIFAPSPPASYERPISPSEVDPYSPPRYVKATPPPPEEESMSLVAGEIPTSVCSIMVGGDAEDVWSCVSTSIKSTESSKDIDKDYDYDQEAIYRDLLPSPPTTKKVTRTIFATKKQETEDDVPQPYDEEDEEEHREIRLTLSAEALDDFDRAIAAQTGEGLYLTTTI
uniref:Uncharacterized protein n=1 Tax=Grammatophora oceanica TaxID=210454 RepID=A0A7S1UPA5_9STRA